MISFSKVTNSKQFKKIASIGLMGSLCVMPILSIKTFARDVYVNVDDNIIHSMTLNDDVDTILNEVGVKVSNEDIVEKFDNPDGSLNLNVKRSLNVSIRDNFRETNIKTFSGTVLDVITEAGFKLNEYDIINYDLNSEIKNDAKIIIIRRVKVNILVDGEEKEYIIPHSSVRNALNYTGISLGENDIINLELNSKLHNDTKVIINRVKFEDSTNIETISRKTITQYSDELDIGVRKITQEGKDGKRELTIHKTIQDNEVINSEIINSKIIEEPIDTIILEGCKKQVTQQSDKKLSQNNSTSYVKPESNNVSKVLYGSATAYTASKGARTSTGKIPREGETVAVNPKIIPYGSKVLVEAEDGSFKKTLIAQDTGGALRKGSAIADIYMDSVQSCKSFGRKSVKISILK